MIENVIQKLRDLNIASNTEGPLDAEFCLNELNATFIALIEEFTLLTDEERNLERNRNIYFGAQQTFHSAGTKLIRRIFNPIPSPTEQEIEILSSIEENINESKNVPSSENEPEQPTNDENVAMTDALNEQQGISPTDETVAKEQPSEQKEEPMVVDEAKPLGEQPKLTEEEQSKLTENDGAVGGVSIVSVATNIRAVASTSSFVPPAEQPKTMLPYKKYVYLMMPIYTLPRIMYVTAEQINAILKAIEQMQERAKEENFSLEQLQFMIIGYVHHLMDATSQALWLWQIEDSQPTLDVLVSFLLKRSRTIAPIASTSESASTSAALEPPNSKKKRKVCQMCGQPHFLHRCTEFLNMKLQTRRAFVNEQRLCQNCFSGQHTTAQCMSGPCKLCNPAKHNSLLCFRSDKPHKKPN